MIELQPQQQAHVARLTKILLKHRCALDFSVMGAGKTYSTSYLSLQPQFNFGHVVVICPVSVQPKWTSMGQKHGVALKKCISYHSLRAAKGKQPALLQTGAAAGQAQGPAGRPAQGPAGTGAMGAGTAPSAGAGQVTLCCCQLTDDCLTSEVLVALQSQMLLHCTCVIAVTLRIVALKGKVLSMLTNT